MKSREIEFLENLGKGKSLIEIESEEEPETFVKEHLSQRAVIAIDVLPLLEAEAKKRSGIRTDLSPNLDTGSLGRATEKAGKMFNVGKTYISESKKLKETKQKGLCPYCNQERPFEIKLIPTIDKKAKVYQINFSCHMIIRKFLRNGVKNDTRR